MGHEAGEGSFVRRARGAGKIHHGRGPALPRALVDADLHAFVEAAPGQVPRDLDLTGGGGLDPVAAHRHPAVGVVRDLPGGPSLRRGGVDLHCLPPDHRVPDGIEGHVLAELLAAPDVGHDVVADVRLRRGPAPGHLDCALHPNLPRRRVVLHEGPRGEDGRERGRGVAVGVGHLDHDDIGVRGRGGRLALGREAEVVPLGHALRLPRALAAEVGVRLALAQVPHDVRDLLVLASGPAPHHERRVSVLGDDRQLVHAHGAPPRAPEEDGATEEKHAQDCEGGDVAGHRCRGQVVAVVEGRRPEALKGRGVALVGLD
mmetsp:Transcript_102474/g.295006  ORF Transcript_102474/g.295006 Transcript_102474/m.295006 type:complete len:316 (-) Transcript_102474:1325-2272(-)